MADTDLAHRLAEIRASLDAADDFTRARMGNVYYLLSIVDSLTAERDTWKECADAAAAELHVAATHAAEERFLAEAAEAEVTRLREALFDAAVEVQHAHDGSREQCTCEMHARFAALSASQPHEEANRG